MQSGTEFFFFMWVLTTLELALDQAKIFKALKANLTNKIFSLSQAKLFELLENQT